jgi:hypothetical protein
MNTAQNDPGQFIPIEDRLDMARKHQIKFSRLMDPDFKFVAVKGMQPPERTEARLHQKLYDIES